jgi:hypothetical protein
LHGAGLLCERPDTFAQAALLFFGPTIRRELAAAVALVAVAAQSVALLELRLLPLSEGVWLVVRSGVNDLRKLRGGWSKSAREEDDGRGKHEQGRSTNDQQSPRHFDFEGATM